MGQIIEVKNLVKNFSVHSGLLDILVGRKKKYVHAVSNVTFDIKKQEVLGLAGESGSGKSTIGRLILKLIDKTSGEIKYKGEDISKLSMSELNKLRDKIQIVFQDPVASLNPRMSVGDSIIDPLIIHNKYDRKKRKEYALDLMEKVGLSPAKVLYDKYPHQLSGGQSQRVVLARALITNPDFIVADEPIAAADVSIRALILELMKKLKNEFNLTYLFITHDLATAKYLCDRIAILYLGKLIEIGSKDQVFSTPLHPYTKALLEAVPVPDPDHRRKEPLPKGEIPDAINPPSGCYYHPRCNYAMDKCSKMEPKFFEVEKGHKVACFLVEQNQEECVEE